MTDTQILFGILQNDGRAWNHICNNMRNGFISILKKSYNWSGYASVDIEDLFQDACLILMQKCREGKVKVVREGSIFSCLVQIGKYCACNLIRKRRPLCPEEEAVIVLNLHEEDKDFEMSVDQKQQEQNAFLDRVFDSIPDSCKLLLKKFYWEHKPMDEIASIMGLRNADSAKTQKNKCMNKFKEIASKLLESDEFAEEAVRAAVERAALKEIIETARENAQEGIRIAALDQDDE